MEEIRIKLLECVGWTGLTRKGRLVDGALRGFDPVDGVFKLAPNPTKSLDSLQKIITVVCGKGYCGSIRERFHESVYEEGLALAEAKEKSKALYRAIFLKT